jgi:hypothetical protein
MAKAPGHQFGQLVGLLVEEIVQSVLQEFADRYGYYLDKKGPRGKAREGKKVTWLDKYDCEHDLDFVIERGGSADVRGRPLAFIETAWRRYTKHSRNKAQEIQGAILPTAERHQWDAPFLGVVLVGFFTAGAIEQMQRSGFHVLYVHRSAIISAFKKAGIVIDFDEDTPDRNFKAAVKALEKLTDAERVAFKRDLRSLLAKEFSDFVDVLAKALGRQIKKIVVTPLFGVASEFTSIEEAKRFLSTNIDAPQAHARLLKIDLLVCFNNGDRIDASFHEPEKARAFLDYVGS